MRALCIQIGNENEEAIQEETVANVNYTEATNFDHSQSKPRCIPMFSSPFLLITIKDIVLCITYRT